MKFNFISILWMVLAMVNILYGLAIAALGSGTKFFLIWFLIAFIFLGFAWISHFQIWKKWAKSIKIIIVCLLILSSAFFIMIQTFIISHFSDSGKDNLDYLIILGAQVHDSSPSMVLKFRLDKAIQYLEDNQKTKCIVSGGQGNNETKSEAEVMAQYLIQHGISANRITQENHSMTTEENLKNSLKLIGQRERIGIVTNNFHVFRALQLAKSLGVENVCGVAAKSSSFYLANNLLREFLAYIKFLFL